MPQGIGRSGSQVTRRDGPSDCALIKSANHKWDDTITDKWQVRWRYNRPITSEMTFSWTNRKWNDIKFICETLIFKPSVTKLVNGGHFDPPDLVDLKKPRPDRVKGQPLE